MCMKSKSRVLDEDRVIGDNFRKIRILKGLKQQDIADRTGITFQQIQKYENGSNRIAASRLLQFSEIFDIDINAFFEGLQNEKEKNIPLKMSPEVLKIALFLNQIENKSVLKTIKSIIEGLNSKKS